MRRAHHRNNRELYVLVVDLDRFKTVNDGLGHEVGDSLLSVTGRRLSTLIGPGGHAGAPPRRSVRHHLQRQKAEARRHSLRRADPHDDFAPHQACAAASCS